MMLTYAVFKRSTHAVHLGRCKGRRLRHIAKSALTVAPRSFIIRKRTRKGDSKVPYAVGYMSLD
jgi:hypothetical protein